MPHQPVQIHISCRQPELVQDLQESLAVAARVGGNRVVKIPVGALGADFGQAVRGEAEHRGSQHGNQGHVLPGVIHQVQHGDDGRDFHSLEKPAVLLERAGDIPFSECGGKGGGAAAGRTHKDDDILRGARPHGPGGGGYRIAFIQ